MATAEMVQDLSHPALANDVIPLFGGAVLGATKDVGIVTGSLIYPTVPFFAPRTDQQELIRYWGELLHSGMRTVYLVVPMVGSQWEQLLGRWLQSVYLAPSFREQAETADWDRLELDLMRLGSLQADWDGEGAEAVSAMSVHTAKALLRLAQEARARYPDVECQLPVLYASVDGGIAMKWNRGQKELKCVALGSIVETTRWSSSDCFESDGFWEVPAAAASEHFEWLLR